MNLIIRLRALAFSVLCTITCAASAVPISYTFSGVGSGRLGTQSFTDAAFVLTGSADTNSVWLFDVGVFLNPLTTLRIDVAGMAQALAVDAFDLYSNNNVPGVGLIDELLGDVVDVSDAKLAGFDATSALGPLAVSADYLAAFMTTVGEFQLDSASAVLFSSTTDAKTVPVAPTLVLVATALAMCGRRRPVAR